MKKVKKTNHKFDNVIPYEKVFDETILGKIFYFPGESIPYVVVGHIWKNDDNGFLRFVIEAISTNQENQ
jgi:hypothetical protein